MSYAIENPWLTLAAMWMSVALTAIISELILKSMNRFLRHMNIRKHGYPPPHCDADGDFKPEKKVES